MINSDKFIDYIQNKPFMIGLIKYILNLRNAKWVIPFLITELIVASIIFLMPDIDYTILRGGFPTILSGIIAIDIAIVALWLPIVINYKQKEFDNYFIIKDFSQENTTVSKAVIHLFGLNNIYYNFILSISVFIVILFLGMVTVDKFVLFILFTAIVLFSIVTIGQIITLSNLVRNLEPNNISTLILNQVKNEVNLLNKNKGYKDSSTIFNNYLEYTDLLISHFCIETFRNKEMMINLRIDNIMFLLSDALYIRQKISEILDDSNLIKEKYVWFKEDINKEQHIINTKLINLSTNYPNITKVVNTIYKNSEYNSYLITALANYPANDIERNEFPLVPFIINLIHDNELLINELNAETIGKEVLLSSYHKLIRKPI